MFPPITSDFSKIEDLKKKKKEKSLFAFHFRISVRK